jgi:hypothetical protein
MRNIFSIAIAANEKYARQYGADRIATNFWFGSKPAVFRPPDLGPLPPR